MVESTSYDVTFGFVIVTFDKPIVNQPLSTANWMANGFNPTAATVTGADTLQLTVPAGMETPFDLEYFATPPDVVGAPPNGLDVEPFVMPVS